jgi:hypothetical protein
MRTLIGLLVPLLLATGLFAQYHGGFRNPRPFVHGTFGGVVFPGGGPRLTVPGAIADPTFATRLGGTVAGQGFWRRPSVPGTRRPGTVVVYGYPVYVGGYFDNAYLAEPAPQQLSSSTVIDPSRPAPASIDGFGSDDAPDPTTPTAAAAESQPVEEPASTAEPSHYLIAFKDHSVYSAVAYWVDGDTLHYFTSGNTHNQVSLALIDRDLTERLNKESGLEVKLP